MNFHSFIFCAGSAGHTDRKPHKNPTPKPTSHITARAGPRSLSRDASVPSFPLDTRSYRRRTGDRHAAGAHVDRRADVPRLRPRVGRLHPLGIRRPPAVALWIGFHRHARLVVRQSLLLRRRRHAGGARRQGVAVRPVRDPTADGGRHRPDRPVRRVADRPARRRQQGRAVCDRVAGAKPALLRAHVHEPQGCAVRGRDGDPAARARARFSGI